MIIIGEQEASNKFIKQLSNIFDLKHVSILSTTQPLIFLGKKLVKHNDNSISISSPRSTTTSCFNPLASTANTATAFQQHCQNDLLWIQHHLWQKNNIINIDLQWGIESVRVLGRVGQLLWLSLVQDLDLQHMQQETSANILLHQHSLTFNNSNIVFVTSRALSTINFICVLNLLRASIFLFNKANAYHCSSNATATPTGPATSTQGNQHQDLWWPSWRTTCTATARRNRSSQQVLQKPSSTPSAQPSQTPSISSSSSPRLKTTSASAPSTSTQHQPNIVLFCDSSSATSLVQRMGINKRTKHIQLRFLWIQDLHQAGQLVLRRVSTENNPADAFTKTLPAAHLQRHLPAVGLQTDVANEAGEYNNIFLVVDNIKKQKQLQATLCQQLRPQQAPQVVQLHRQLRSATTTGHQQQHSGQQISILQLSGGTSPTTLDNWQQIDQHQSAGSSLQQQEQQTTCDGQLFGNNELFMIQHQADSSEQPRDPPTSATTRSESQRSSLEIIAEALNRQQQRRGRRHLSPQPILTPLSTSSVGEMHQSQRSNDDNHDRGEATTRTTKEEEERQQPRQRRRQQQDIKKKKEARTTRRRTSRETTTTKKKEETKKEETTKKEERKVKEEEGKGEEDRQRQRRPSSQQRRWTTTTIMTATLFFSIFFSLFIFHLPRPLSESTGSTKEAVGASSSTTSNLDDIKQRLVNSIENLLDSDNKLNSDLDNNKKQQQDNTMSSSDQPTAQTAAQATVQPTMVPSSAGTSSTSVLPQLNPITLNESNIIRQLNAVTISMKLHDNNRYQTSSATLLNLYDNFSGWPSWPTQRQSTWATTCPSSSTSATSSTTWSHQRSSSTPAASEWFICLTEEEHQHYQLHQHLQARPFNHHQQQRPRLHSDSISAINYLIYVGSTATTSETVLPNVPDDSTLYLYSFVFIATGSSTWTKYHRRAGFIELEPTSGATVAPTSEWGYLNSIIQGGSTSTLNFLREASFQSNHHIINFNLISSPHHVHIASVISMVQHPNIRQRLRNWLHQFHHATYQETQEFFDASGNLRNKWLQDSSSSSIMTSPGATTAATPGHRDEAATATTAAAAASASATASPSTTTSASGTSITINQLQPGTSFIIKYKRYNNNNEEGDVQMDNGNSWAATTTTRWWANMQTSPTDNVRSRPTAASSCSSTTLKLRSSTLQLMAHRSTSSIGQQLWTTRPRQHRCPSATQHRRTNNLG